MVWVDGLEFVVSMDALHARMDKGLNKKTYWLSCLAAWLL